MIIYPDIEIQDGRSVSLPRGRKEEATVFDISPLKAAENFQLAGAEWLQVVDIDGVFQGGRFNSGMIRESIDDLGRGCPRVYGDGLPSSLACDDVCVL